METIFIAIFLLSVLFIAVYPIFKKHMKDKKMFKDMWSK